MKFIKKADIILIVSLLVLSLIPEGLFIATGQNRNTSTTNAVITVNGKLYKTIPLSEHSGTDQFTIQTEAGYNTVVVNEHSIGIVDADCPDKICVSEGFISQPGATSVCLPHKVMIEIRAGRNEDPDIIPAH
ncbi:MAG: NusG domain II-containing protein [Megasphaera sp.]|jgi:hypothetical protein|nr:NusG domain II-containing protein [Megasphaera sp.]MCH4188636.1 NusG domain II-containing protein [Megasphaera sp.]MCH4218511.1 NusG domain II-containing protein [Megasphaera sp.]